MHMPPGVLYVVYVIACSQRIPLASAFEFLIAATQLISNVKLQNMRHRVVEEPHLDAQFVCRRRNLKKLEVNRFFQKMV